MVWTVAKKSKVDDFIKKPTADATEIFSATEEKKEEPKNCQACEEAKENEVDIPSHI